jgi:hypothetical protein
MIDRHYGHLARDGRDHAIKLLDPLTTSEAGGVHGAGAAWTPNRRLSPLPETEAPPEQEFLRSPLADSNRRPPLSMKKGRVSRWVVV